MFDINFVKPSGHRKKGVVGAVSSHTLGAVVPKCTLQQLKDFLKTAVV